MSLNAWEWEDEDAAIIDPLTSLHSFSQTTNDCVVEDYLGTRVQEYDYDGRYRTLGSLEEEHVSPFEPDVPQVVPCKFIISLAFPVNFDDEEPKIVDMVIFPGMAKVFLDSGVKVCGVVCARMSPGK
ncbi:Hypothetical predicted protein [Marmota monax]|uniref:DUF4550 domain-containing protein n=1 Tax=Marmota monax TaxID=9995 RepID=A0A5E4CER0_MARMO|nr:Hypothetical predicted protein [Marmota monax]